MNYRSAGVIKVLCQKITEKDKEKGKQDLLFDIVAGTSIGAMNGAVLVSQFLQTRSWVYAIKKLEEFWTDKEKGLASTISQDGFAEFSGWTKWQEASMKSIQGVASTEEARRYYSVKYFFWKGSPRIHEYLEPRPDLKFYDDDANKWYIHSNSRLKQTILNFENFPIATTFLDKDNFRQPRFLVFSVDAAEGVVTFDSYEQADGSRKSEYGKYRKEKGYEHTINYNDGISIEHVAASGTLPEFYDYQEIDGRKFWDGGLLSNTPFRELLQAHQEYWMYAAQERNDNDSYKIPDLEVYVVNLHPSKQPNLPTDHDGVKDRQNDITYCDRNSHHDERVGHILMDYVDFATQIKNLSIDAISRMNNEIHKTELKKRFEAILATGAISKDNKGERRKYEDLIKNQFKLNKVVRIERTSYNNSIYGKTGDFTLDTINSLIKEGETDTYSSLDQDYE